MLPPAFLVCAVLVCGCQSLDSCSRPRSFKRFNFAPTAPDEKTLRPEQLPDRVQIAVNRFMVGEELDRTKYKSTDEAARALFPDPADRRVFAIVLARDAGRYILLEIQNPRAFDANDFLVYSKSLDCIVGRFVWHFQG